MKQARGLIILLVLGVLLIGYIVIWEGDKSPKQGTSRNIINKDKEFFDKTDRVEISGDGFTLTVEKDKDGEWWLTQPLHYPADKDKIISLLDDIELAIPQRTLKEAEDLSENRIRDYGLAKPVYTISLKKPESEPVKMELGGKVLLTPQAIYARGDNTKDVHVIGDSVLKNLSTRVDDYRKHKIFDVLPSQTSTMNLTGMWNYSMGYSGNKWSVTAPFEAAVASLNAEQAVDAVIAMSADKFVDDKPADYARYGLDKPAATIDLTDSTANARKFSMLIGKKVEKESEATLGDAYYARTPDRPTVFTVLASKIDAVKKDPVMLVDVKLSSVAYTDMSKLVIKRGTDEIEIQKENIDLRFKKPEEGEADGDAADEFFRLLGELSAVKAVLTDKFEEYGLNGSVLFDVNPLEGKDPFYRLEIGRYDDTEKGWFVRRNNEGVVLVITDEKFKRLMGISKWDFIPRKIESFEADDVHYFSVMAEAINYSFNNRDKKWACETKADAEVDEVKVKQLLEEFEKFQAVRTFSYDDSKAVEFGFDKPRSKLVVSVKVKKEGTDTPEVKTTTFIFGGDVPGIAKEGVYAMIEGSKYAFVIQNSVYAKLYEKLLKEPVATVTPAASPLPAPTVTPAPAPAAQ